MQRIMLFHQVPFDQIRQHELLKSLIDFARRRNKKLILNMNAYGVVMFMKNPRYASVIKKAHIIYPDGWGPVLASKFFQHPLPERVNVGDFIDPLLSMLNKNCLKLYLLGCQRYTIEATKEKIQHLYPDIVLSGASPGFFNYKEEKAILKHIAQTKPNLVLVGMGIPQQELWLDKHWKNLPSAVYMGVGGVFYYISGLKSRAPKWMRNNSLEWIYRFIQEPKKLWRRYSLNTLYFMLIFLQSILVDRLKILLVKKSYILKFFKD
jgi:N-acetylglucosaminyldiphosphoundecaprenol N-acetyl-beta-D-mannosaminyltransferase